MKIVKKGMRVWFTIASVFSFLAGWVLFSHSAKPAPLQSSQPAVAAPAASNSIIRSINNNSPSIGFPFSVQSQSSFSSPRLRTGGS
jgi:hypothetical protein